MQNGSPLAENVNQESIDELYDGLVEAEGGQVEEKIVSNSAEVLQNLERLLKFDSVPRIKRGIQAIKDSIVSESRTRQTHELPADATFTYDYLSSELDQILNTHSSERMHYYIRRLKKGLTEVKTSRINDINLNKWKEYDNINTDSLWMMDRRDDSGAHLGWYWGNFVPQIPQQMLLRYTKKGDWVLDPFMGSGTTIIESKRLGRNSIGIEIQESVAKQAQMLAQYESSQFESKQHVVVGDCVNSNYENILHQAGTGSVQHVILHPPYWNILQFSDNPNDLCNAETLEDYLKMLGTVLAKSFKVLDRGRYLSLIVGDKYHKGELIPLGFYAMQEALKCGFRMKSIVVKNFEETRGKMNSKELWRYRALVGGFYLFKHEYIMIFRKP